MDIQIGLVGKRRPGTWINPRRRRALQRPEPLAEGDLLVIGHGLAGKDRDQMFVKSGADGHESPVLQRPVCINPADAAPNTGVRGVTAIAI